jgi:VWFA-related protein
MRRGFFFAAAAAVPLFVPPACLAQAVHIESRVDSSPAREAPRLPSANIRVDSSLVLIPAHVTTSSGASITTLDQGSFHVFEDGVEQAITFFAKDDAPLSIGLVFDSSGSMQNKMGRSAEAAAKFFNTAGSDDEFFLVEFNERPKLTVPFTSNSEEIYKHIAHARPFGRTSLLDAIHLAMQQMKHAHNLRKAIVILSDGGDNRSRYTAAEVRNAMLESDVQLYAMGIFSDAGPHKLTPEEQNGPHLLEELAEQTGGRDYPVERIEDLASISERISQELRSEYVLGYAPANKDRDGKYRDVKVRLSVSGDSPDMRLYFRHGYQAPEQ